MRRNGSNRFQSTPPVKAATLCICGVARAARISIHAAREGGDLEELGLAYDFDEISIHAAREGGDILVAALVNRQAISIHAAREGGDSSGMSFPNKCNISIHAAREGGDYCIKLIEKPSDKFQSTPPVKAATGGKGYTDSLSPISIHAAREGGDFSLLHFCHNFDNFNPRRP